MATYTYKCEKCGVVFDVTQGMTEDHLRDCPECKEKDVLKRVITGGLGFKHPGYPKRYR